MGAARGQLRRHLPELQRSSSTGSTSAANLHADYPIRFGPRARQRIDLVVDVFIVTTGNTLTPAGQLADPRATATNPDFLKKGILFTDPRSIRVGVRVAEVQTWPRPAVEAIP